MFLVLAKPSLIPPYFQVSIIKCYTRKNSDYVHNISPLCINIYAKDEFVNLTRDTLMQCISSLLLAEKESYYLYA